MITETTAVTLRQNLGDMLNRVLYRRDSIVITKDGKPVAALVDAALFERIRRMQARFDALTDRLAKGFESTTESAGLAEIEGAAAKARRETAQAWRVEGRLPAVPSTDEPVTRRAAGVAPKAKKARTAKAARSAGRR